MIGKLLINIKVSYKKRALRLVVSLISFTRLKTCQYKKVISMSRFVNKNMKWA